MNRILPVKLPVWHSANGEVIACVEKLKVMQDNLQELVQMAQDAFEDAILMGCDENQVRTYLVDLMKALENPYCSSRVS